MGGREGRPCDHWDHRLRTARIGRRRIRRAAEAGSETYAPASGEVLEANAELHNTPEKLNTDPHGAAWLIKARLTNASELNGLMDAAAYEAYIADKGKEASA